MSDSEQPEELSIDDEIAELFDSETESTEEEIEALEAAEAPPEAPAEPEPAPEVPSLTPPDRWNGRFKEAFQALNNLNGLEGLPEGFDPRAIQQAWLDFHQDRQSYITPLEQERAYYAQQLSEFNEVLAPYEQTWQMAGLTPAQGVRQLMGWAGSFQKDPEGTIERLAKQAGVDITEYAARKLQEEHYQDPQVKALEQQVSQLTGQLRSFQMETLRQQQSATQQEIEQQVYSFRYATNEHGELLHPHYETLEPLMYEGYLGAVNAVQTGQRAVMPTLDELYEQALWAHPETRAQALAAQAQQNTARSRNAAEKAATASRSVKSKGTGKGTEPEISIEDEVAMAYDAMAD